MNVHVGMDVHPKRSQIVFLDAAGGEQRSRNLANDPVKLVPVFGVLPPGTPVAFEAAYGWAWLVELLEELEQEPHLVHPSCCKAIAAARLKNDKVDARTLASCCGPTCSPSLDRPTVAWTATVASRSGRGKRSQPPRQRAVKPACHGPQRHSYTSSHPTVSPTATP
jgi:transposase